MKDLIRIALALCLVVVLSHVSTAAVQSVETQVVPQAVVVPQTVTVQPQVAVQSQTVERRLNIRERLQIRRAVRKTRVQVAVTTATPTVAVSSQPFAVQGHSIGIGD